MVGPMEKAGGTSKVTNGMKQKPKFTGDCRVGRVFAVGLEKEVCGCVETPVLVALAGLVESFSGGSHWWKGPDFFSANPIGSLEENRKKGKGAGRLASGP